jgi:hypothetical protein
MEQLEFPFIHQRYDVFSDSMIPVTEEYIRRLEQINWAYGKIRQAMDSYSGFLLPRADLDEIHEQLMKRIHEPDRSK